jgi:hypothetical protein
VRRSAQIWISPELKVRSTDIRSGAMRRTSKLMNAGRTSDPTPKSWLTRGFEGFMKGTCGNAGQNLYVSRAGVLQRIHQYDLNKDGYTDLVFCNGQNHRERVPIYVYQDPLGAGARIDLPSDGAMAGIVADLNGNGCDDLVLGMIYDGSTITDLNAIIYYGGPGGWGESRHQRIPAPFCTAVAAGDFNGNGRVDLAFLCFGKTRIFYQSDLGFEPRSYVELEIEGGQLEAADLDADGCAELLVRAADGRIDIYWGGDGGIDPGNSMRVCPGTSGRPAPIEEPQEEVSEFGAGEEDQRSADANPLVQILELDGVPHLFAPDEASVRLIPFAPDRTLGKALVVDCPNAMAVEAGDVNGDGRMDLVFACREPWEDAERSWIYWGSEKGFSDERRSALKTHRACDVAVGDLDGNGFADIVICQNQSAVSFTGESLIYRGGPDGVIDGSLRLVTEDARRTFIVRPSPDGDPQVVFVNHFGGGKIGDVKAAIFWGGPDGYDRERTTPLRGRCAVEAVCCDYNDDGRPDVMLANCAEMSLDDDPGSFVYLNGPDGFPFAPSLVLPTCRAHGAACADLNRDGYLDLVFCGFSNPELLIFYGTSDGFDTENPARIRLEHEDVEFAEPRWIFLADLNGDGWLDLVVPTLKGHRSFILWGGPEGFSMEHSQALSIVRGTCVQAADLTGNGHLDLIIGGHRNDPTGPFSSFVHIYWNDGKGLREDNRMLLPSKAAHGLAVADFNNDGLLDIAVCSYDDGRGDRDIDSYIYWNRARRGFSAADRLRLPTHSAAGCFAADFNEDGWIDLAMANHKTFGDHVGDSHVWWNGPEGFDRRNTTALPTIGAHMMSTVNPGNIMDRGPEEFYISSPFKLPENSAVQTISWEAELPPKSWVTARMRWADTELGLEDAPWVGPGESGSEFEKGDRVDDVPPGVWIQYRLALGARNGGATPRVVEVSVSYSA